MPPNCALFGGFAIGARVPLLWQQREHEMLKPNSITLSGLKLVRSWSQTGSTLVADQLRTSFETDSVMQFGF